jgi:aryl-alcohol dehydrogenase-like predicted oxidoreductase
MNDTAERPHGVLENVEMGLGTWAWGDRLVWGYGRGTYSDDDLKAAFEASLDGGIRLLDSAEVYGQGRSETIVGQLIKLTDQKVLIATKFMPYPWRLSRGALLRALRGSLRRLDVAGVDLYQIHWPMPPVRIETWMDAMAEAVQSGLTRSVGVSNYDRDQMQRAYDELTRQGIPLTSNQVEYHLLNRKIEKNGLLKLCTDLGVKVIAYSPLAMGVLTGKYSPENLPQGFRRNQYNRQYLHKIQPLIKLLKTIGNDHAGKSASQVALNWLICKGALPIPGAKNVDQAESNAGAIGWRLTPDEIALLEEISDQVTSRK